jgi:hypothetical protein
VVVWDSYLQDGSNDGVFGQRFVVAFEIGGHAVGGGGSSSTDVEADGATGQDRVETVVTTPNAGTISIIERAISRSAPSGIAFFGEQVNITAPPATAANPLILQFELDASLIRSGQNPAAIVPFRNGVAVPACTGPPGTASPDPCVAGLTIQGDLDVQLTVLTSVASDWNFALPCYTGFDKGVLLIKENVPGKEKLIVKLLGGPAAVQTDFGDPLVADGTPYRLRLFDALGASVAAIEVARPGDTTCSGGAMQCWKAIGGAPPAGKGYKYKDTDLAAAGVSQVMMKATGLSTKIAFKAKGPSPPFPVGIPALLMSTSAVTVQVDVADASAPVCFAATLTDIRKQQPDAFKAK